VAIAHEARDPFRAVRALELGLAEPFPRPLDPAATAAALMRMAERQALMTRLRRQYAQSLDLAVTDSLTGVFNRRYLDAYFELQARARHERLAPADGAALGESGFALLMIDVDRFKEINDREGHAAGDAALVGLAAMLMRELREIDTVARIGGDEFAILLPGTGVAGAEATARRLRERAGVSISVGTAVYGIDGLTGDELARAADAALYAAKSRLVEPTATPAR
jgi:two-component system cell cycle response regulator